MKKIFVSLLFIPVFSVSAFALPERADVLVSGLISSDTYRGIAQANTPPDQVKFNSVNVKVIYEWSEDLLKLCGMDKGYSRSASILQVSFSLFSDELNQSKAESKLYYFATPHKVKDLVLCNSK